MPGVERQCPQTMGDCGQATLIPTDPTERSHLEVQLCQSYPLFSYFSFALFQHKRPIFFGSALEAPELLKGCSMLVFRQRRFLGNIVGPAPIVQTEISLSPF